MTTKAAVLKRLDSMVSSINKIIDSRDDYSTVSIKGVKNLSASDLDELIMYADLYMTGNYRSSNLMSLYGETAEVWAKYKLPEFWSGSFDAYGPLG